MKSFKDFITEIYSYQEDIELEELSKQTLNNYINKAATSHATATRKISKGDYHPNHNSIIKKRSVGLNRALDKTD